MGLTDVIKLAWDVFKEPQALLFVLFALVSWFLYGGQRRLRKEHDWCISDMHCITGIMLDAITALAATTGGQRGTADLTDIRRRVNDLFKAQAERQVKER